MIYQTITAVSKETFLIGLDGVTLSIKFTIYLCNKILKMLVAEEHSASVVWNKSVAGCKICRDECTAVLRKNAV